MAWFATSGVVWRRRAAISVDIAAATPVDVDITIPREWDEFWDTIDTAGNNLRVVWYDGQTVLTYAIDNGSGGAFSKASRLGRIRIDAMTVPAATAVLLVWLYFDPDTTQASGASAVTIASPRTGWIELGTPGQFAFLHQPAPARSSKPRSVIQKTVNEQVWVWVRYDRALGRRSTPGNRSQIHEEPLYATISVQDNAAADQAGMYDTAKLRWVWSRGAMWLRCRIKAGTSGTNYTAVILTRTILPGETTADQQLETRIGVAIRDALDP